MSINNDPERITLDDLVNARRVSAVIQAFYRQLAAVAVMDQTNPLAELTHKRRLSALGPGGLTRERPGSRCATALQPVRPHVPIETRRPEHRAHHEPVVLRARERTSASSRRRTAW